MPSGENVNTGKQMPWFLFTMHWSRALNHTPLLNGWPLAGSGAWRPACHYGKSSVVERPVIIPAMLSCSSLVNRPIDLWFSCFRPVVGMGGRGWTGNTDAKGESSASPHPLHLGDT